MGGGGGGGGGRGRGDRRLWCMWEEKLEKSKGQNRKWSKLKEENEVQEANPTSAETSPHVSD